MATNTYVALDKVTVGTATPSITFSSIPSTYTDLIIVANFNTATGNQSTNITFNGDTGSDYSWTYLLGNGTTASSSRGSSDNRIYNGSSATATSGNTTNSIIQVQNYANTTTYKTIISRSNAADYFAQATVGLWRGSTGSATQAITSITLTCPSYNYIAGSTFSLYGITAQTVPGTAKATGGTISYDAFGYVYHTFTSTGTFTPSVPVTCDYLIVAGGGGGGAGLAQNYAGTGGGAGGLRAFTNQTISSALTATVGAGGSAMTSSGSAGTAGVNSSFNSTSVTGGGYTSGFNAGASGGSGSGGGAGSAGGAGNAGSYSPVEGYAGSAGFLGGANRVAGGGGGGAGGAATDGTDTTGGNGGAGASTYNSIDFSGWLSTTSSGVSGKIAGGGGGGLRSGATGGTASAGGGAGSTAASGTVSTAGNNATANTGGGGGGGGPATSGTDNKAGGNGGSGIVIIRYQG